MPDPKQTVESIRAFLGSGSASVTPAVKTLAADYAEMCREANFRLSRCADYLREGLRGEALAHAAARPHLIDLVAGLQFREVENWERACTAHGLVRPGRLAMDTATHLIEATRQQEPLQELLGRHRYLALARADLSQRLAVLRQLIIADPASPCWKRDAEELERARLATIRNEAAAAARTGNGIAVNKLLAELNAGPWLLPVPADLMEALSLAQATLRESTALNQLRGLVPRVRAARSGMSYDEGRQVFGEWGKVVRESKVNVPPELRVEILPLAHWLDEQDENREKQKEFRAACAALAGAINARRPLEQLTKLYRTAVGYDLEIPADLASTYRHAVDAARREQRAEKRRHYALGAALIGAIVIVLLALAYVVFEMGSH